MSVSNKDIAEVLSEIAEYLAMEDVPFKPRSYEKAAEVIGGLQEEVSSMYNKGGLKALEDIPGVGVSIAEKIEEFLTTGRVAYYQQLKKKTPVDLESLSRIEGLGPKSIKKLYKELGVRTVAQLEAAGRAGKISQLDGFGEKAQAKILKSIAFAKRLGGRFLLGTVLPQARSIEAQLANVSGVERVVVAGSLRRRKETIGDIDVLVISKHPATVMERFVSLPQVSRVLSHGDTKSAVTLNSGLNVDVRVVPASSYGAALNYFTGSKDHNVTLREIAIKKGYKLNEYGLFKGERAVAGKTEEQLYKALGLRYIEPELRENSGEIEAASDNALPRSIGYNDIKGDLQVQTNWTDGTASIEQMAKAAHNAGLHYIAITDHTKRLAMTHGLDEKRLLKQMAEIDALNKKFGNSFTILKGSECDILKDGTLDLPDRVLSRLDVVGISVHSHFNLSRREQTERVKRAMANPNADILFHPTGRLIERRQPYDIDMEEIIKHAKKTKTVLEINALPERLDLKDEYIKKCVSAGVRMSVDSDAHAPEHFQLLEYGIAQARRGWAEAKDIVNTRNAAAMQKLLKKS